MKQWHQELASVGLAARYIDQLQNQSAEQFVEMWEAAVYLGAL